MSKSSSVGESLKGALEELAQARDEVKLKMHLLSLEARQRWGEIEGKLSEFEQTLEHKGTQAAEATASKARSLAESARELLRGAPRQSDASKPAAPTS